MRTSRLAFGIVVTAIFAALTAPAAAQRLPATVHPATAGSVSTLPNQLVLQGPTRRASTGVERTLWGVGGGLLALLAVRALQPDTGASTAPPVAAYVAGSLIGVGLVTNAREGLRPTGTALGGLVGAAVGVAILLTACELGGDSLDDPGSCDIGPGLLGGLAFAVTVPLGASFGHARVGHKRY